MSVSLNYDYVYLTFEGLVSCRVATATVRVDVFSSNS